MTDHLYREIDQLREDRIKLSEALYNMIAMYEGKIRNGVNLGKARAALNQHGFRPNPTPVDGDSKHGA